MISYWVGDYFPCLNVFFPSYFFSSSIAISGKVFCITLKRSSSSRVTWILDFQELNLLAPSSLYFTKVWFFICLDFFLNSWKLDLENLMVMLFLWIPTIKFWECHGNDCWGETFLQKVAETLRSRFYRKFRHPRKPRAKNSIYFYFEGLWRCAERGHTTWSKF